MTAADVKRAPVGAFGLLLIDCLALQADAGEPLPGCADASFHRVIRGKGAENTAHLENQKAAPSCALLC
jgi:hypothetical protein